MKILVLDNYDSFTYNLVYLLKELGQEVDVYRNDKIALEAVAQYDKILLSPGPGIPEEAGILLEVIRTYAPTKSILGVCLGHQAIGEAFGGQLLNMGEVLHGVTTKALITDPNERLFRGLPSEIEVCRYHSWTVIPDTLPDELHVTAVDEKGHIMAQAHRQYDVRGVQFHPEAYLTQFGKEMILNWLNQ